MNVLAVVGRSGTGKTTLLCRLIAELKRRGRVVAVVKHCGAGFDLGGENKDSTLFFKAGAESVTLTGREGTAVLDAPRRRLKDPDLAAAHAGADYVFIEGAQTDQGIPAIEVVGLNPQNRVPLREKDRWIVVSARPIRTRKPVFSPEAVGSIVDLIEAETDKTTASAANSDFFRGHDPAVRAVLQSSVVGIAGAGGLGSNVALALARAGAGKLILADFDRIEMTNLNRQQYFADQISRVKVEALAENLRRIPSGTKIIALRVRVRPGNIARIFGEADVLVEAFDKADQKQMLIESWLSRFPDRPIVAASGLAGYGANNRIRERRIGRLTLIGDEAGEGSPGVSPMAPRVAIVAAMQANRVIEILMKTRRSTC
jgi:sulfur carrier protein ThiS adenylyltransferase